MGLNYRKGLCFLLLIMIFSASGCWWGGGGTMHHPIDTVCCDEPWAVKVMYKNDPKDWRVNLAKEAENFQVHYRVSPSNKFVAVPMSIEKLESKLGNVYLQVNMPPVSCDTAGDFVEYFYDYAASYCDCYTKSPVYKAVVVGRR